MSQYEIIIVLISILNLLILVFGLLFAYRQIIISRKIHFNTHEWNRLMSTHETLCDYVVKEIFPIRFKILNTVVDFENQNTDFIVLVKQLDDDKIIALKADIREMLSKFSLVCLQIKKNVLDEDTCYLFLAHFVVTFYRFSKPFIVEYRNQLNEQFKYIDFTDLAESWIKKMEQKSNEYRASIINRRGYKPEIDTKI